MYCSVLRQFIFLLCGVASRQPKIKLEFVMMFRTHNTNLLGMLYFNDRWIEALQGGQKCKITFVNLHKVFENRLFLFVHFQGLIFMPGWTIMRAIEKDKGVLPG